MSVASTSFFGNGVAATYNYDQDYQLTTINSGGGMIQNLTNGYDEETPDDPDPDR